MPLYRKRRYTTFRRRPFGYKKRTYRKRTTYRKKRGTFLGVKRAGRPELKQAWSYTGLNNFDQSWGSAKTITNGITTGIDSVNRIGRVIVVRKLQFLIDVFPQATTTLPVEVVRLVVWKQVNGYTNAGAWANFYDVALCGTLGNACAWGARIRGQKDFPIIYDRPIKLVKNGDAASTPGTIRCLRRITLRWKRGLRVSFIADPAYTDTTKPNHLWFNTIGEQTGASYPIGNVSWKLWFTDV